MKQKRIVGIGIIAVFLVAAVGVWAALRNNSTSSAAGLSVTTSYYPLYEFTRHVAGDRATVNLVTPSSVEPHDYEPTPKQLAAATESDVFVYNGAGIEPWATAFVRSYKGDVVNLSQKVSLLEASEDHHEEDVAGHEEAAHAQDPHFWLDPVAAQTMVQAIADALSATEPADAEYFQSQAASYNAKLQILHEDYEQGLKQCRHRTIVTSHAAFGYVAKRYNLEVVPIAGMSPDAEPTAADMANISRVVKERSIRYIFAERLVSPRLAETVARETGAKTLVYDPIEGLSDNDQQQGKNYIRVQEENLQNLRTALECE